MDQKHKEFTNERIKLFQAKVDNKDFSKYFDADTALLPDSKKARKRRKDEKTNYIHDLKIPSEMMNLGKGKKYFLRTYGCQANEHDGEIMRGLLEAIGFEKATDKYDADLILLNTCAIRENAEDKVFGELGNFRKLKVNNPDLMIGVCGCMSQEESVVNKILKKYTWVDLVFGTHNIHNLPTYVKDAMLSNEKVIQVWSQEGDVIENLPKIRDHKYKAWINISYGCDKFCAYCIVPYTRGRERSRLQEDIVNEVRELHEQGYQEITLLGQNVNAYGKDFSDETSLGTLLREVAEIGIPRIRFTTSHPWDFTDDIVSAMAEYDNIMPHLHLPVQSGSNEILKKMNRKYTRESYTELVNKLKANVPNISLTTDIIVAFPGETQEMFDETLSLVKEIGFEGAFTFIFSPREGTPAAKMESNISKEDAKERLRILNDVVNVGFLDGNMRFEDEIVDVLVEGTSTRNDEVLAGYTPQNKLVNFIGDANSIGKIVKVKVTKVSTWSLQGEAI